MRDHCIVSVVTQSYLTGFACLVQSLRKHGRMGDVPIVVIAPEPAVREHPFIAACAHIVQAPDVQELHALAQIAQRKGVPPNAASTFLKFLAFRDFGFRRNIVLDSDLLCLGDARELLEVEADLAAVASVMEDLRDVERCRRLAAPDASEADEYERMLFEGPPVVRRNLNSGLMVVRPSERLVLELLRQAQSESYRHDQHCLNEYIQARAPFATLRVLPQKFNVVRRVYEVLGAQRLRAALTRIVFLHYTGEKPWLASPHGPDPSGYREIWRAAAIDAGYADQLPVAAHDT